VKEETVQQNLQAHHDPQRAGAHHGQPMDVSSRGYSGFTRWMSIIGDDLHLQTSIQAIVDLIDPANDFFGETNRPNNRCRDRLLHRANHGVKDRIFKGKSNWVPVNSNLPLYFLTSTSWSCDSLRKAFLLKENMDLMCVNTDLVSLTV
jgi:hypothetical protein